MGSWVLAGILLLGGTAALTRRPRSRVIPPKSPIEAAIEDTSPPSGWKASDAEIKAVIHHVLTVETDANVVLMVGAIAQRNFLTVYREASGQWTFDRRPKFENMAKLPIRDDAKMLPDPGGKDVFGLRAFELQRHILTTEAARDASAVMTWRTALAKSQGA